MSDKKRRHTRRKSQIMQQRRRRRYFSSFSLPLVSLGFSSLLLNLLPVVMCFCPPRCKCNEVKLLVYCNGTQIDLVPIMLNPQLKELYLGGNRVKNVQAISVYQDLRYLDLSNNGLTSHGIGARNFVMQKKLRVLLLDGNNITQLHNLSFHGLNALHLLNLRQNQLRELHSRIFMGLNQLETLDLSHNLLAFVSNEAFFGLLNLKQLNLQSNKLKQVPSSAFFHMQSLSKLNMASNLIAGSLAELAFAPLTNLLELRLDSNHLSHILPRALHLRNLTYLDLSSNKLFGIPSDSFTELSNLQVLMLSKNQISVLGPNAFRGLRQLRILIISGTPLSYVDRDALRDNPYLERLVMDNNRQLTQILPGTLTHQVRSLRYLSLRANRISTLDANTINTTRIEHINLQENPLVCNCSLNWLAEYLRSNRASNRSLSAMNQAHTVKCYRPAAHLGKALITLSRVDLSCPALDSLLARTLNAATGVAALLVLLIIALLLMLLLLLLLFFRRYGAKCLRRSSSTLSSRAHAEHMIASGVIGGGGGLIVGVGGAAKSHPDHSLYYSTIINEDFTRDAKHYHTMMTTTSTRTSALSVDLHPPLQYVPIAHM